MAKPRSRDNSAVSIAALESEKRKLYISKEDPKRLAEIIAQLEYLYYGRLK